MLSLVAQSLGSLGLGTLLDDHIHKSGYGLACLSGIAGLIDKTEHTVNYIVEKAEQCLRYRLWSMSLLLFLSIDKSHGIKYMGKGN